MNNEFPHYTESFQYEIELTSKCFRALAIQLYEKYSIDLTIDETAVLDTVLCNPGICQRDLAKLILRDRANTGRIIEALEKKELVNRYSDTKNNRLVKKTEITEKGKEALKVVAQRLEPVRKKIEEIMSREEIINAKKNIKEIRESILIKLETSI